MSRVLLMDPVLGEKGWDLLHEALDQLRISTTIFGPEPVHTYDQEVEAATLYRQFEHLETGDTDLALAVKGACRPCYPCFH